MNTPELIVIDLVTMMEDPGNGNPIAVLHDKGSNRLLPIWVGDHEAGAIAMALKKTKTSRPMMHQLLLNTLAKMGGRLARIIIDRLKNNTYYSSLYAEKDGEAIVIDARPTDAIALALFAQVSILVVKGIFDLGSQPNPVPGIFPQYSPEKRQMKPDDMKRLREMLERAREREAQS